MANSGTEKPKKKFTWKLILSLALLGVLVLSVGVLVITKAPSSTLPTASTPSPASREGCSIVSQSPANGASVSAGTPFTASWVLMNTGSEKWPDGEVDIRYVGMQSNVQMHTGADVYDLTTTVQPGATYSFSEPMAAPSNAGDYNETWEVAQGARQICQFGVSVIVP